MDHGARYFECHNQFLTNMVDVICSDVKYDYKTALAWAVSAKNGLVNHNHFSHAQLVFSHNLPHTTNKCLIALEISVHSFDLGLHISALYAARK